MLSVHQDIQTENVITTPESNFDQSFKLIDFGLTHFASDRPQKGELYLRDARGAQMFSKYSDALCLSHVGMLRIEGAPECFRNEHDIFDEKVIRTAHPDKGGFALGWVFSETLVWSVLGTDGIKDYRRRRRMATDRLPELSRTAYSGCFHDGLNVLADVSLMHEEVRSNCGSDRSVMNELALVFEEMMANQHTRPSIHMFRKCLLRILRDGAASGTFDHTFRVNGLGSPRPRGQVNVPPQQPAL